MSYNIIHDNQPVDKPQPWNNIKVNEVKAELINATNLTVTGTVTLNGVTFDNIDFDTLSANSASITELNSTKIIADEGEFGVLYAGEADFENIHVVDTAYSENAEIANIGCDIIECANYISVPNITALEGSIDELTCNTINSTDITTNSVKSAEYNFFPYLPNTKLSFYYQTNQFSIPITGINPAYPDVNVYFTRIGDIITLMITPTDLSLTDGNGTYYISPKQGVAIMQIPVLDFGVEIGGLVHNSIDSNMIISGTNWYEYTNTFFRRERDVYLYNIRKGASLPTTYLELSLNGYVTGLPAPVWNSSYSLYNITITYHIM
jgi:hypothetical protein